MDRQPVGFRGGSRPAGARSHKCTVRVGSSGTTQGRPVCTSACSTCRLFGLFDSWAGALEWSIDHYEEHGD
jgi:hypothetical protein